ncbi:hypothetical protein JQK15_13590 [Sphingobium sp. BHU LFT2]|uniref:hypothetical protein n=1 Tax=Sphingobium sp. BHU LFT2 TaxID=2807634 RepID=UPI001BEAE62A|nr:hypothetical protein [Sphingobium sp. BHU LFT2]MBT2244572.1 hypothetical protein [Sphingobium sp. BHU LFT2]
MTPTLTDTDAYHLDRLTPGWADATDVVRTAAIVRAADYIERTYTLRDAVEDNDPLLLKAIMALAVHALTSTLAEAEADRDIIASEKSGDGIGAIKLTYGDKAADRFPHITAMLRPIAYLTKAGGGIMIGKMVR